MTVYVMDGVFLLTAEVSAECDDLKKALISMYAEPNEDDQAQVQYSLNRLSEIFEIIKDD